MSIFEQYFYDLNQFIRVPGNDTAYSDVVNILEEKIALFEKQGYRYIDQELSLKT